MVLWRLSVAHKSASNIIHSTIASRTFSLHGHTHFAAHCTVRKFNANFCESLRVTQYDTAPYRVLYNGGARVVVVWVSYALCICVMHDIPNIEVTLARWSTLTVPALGAFLSNIPSTRIGLVSSYIRRNFQNFPVFSIFCQISLLGRKYNSPLAWFFLPMVYLVVITTSQHRFSACHMMCSLFFLYSSSRVPALPVISCICHRSSPLQ